MSSKKERKKQNLSLFSQHGNTNKSEVTNPVTELEETSRKVHLLELQHVSSKPKHPLPSQETALLAGRSKSSICLYSTESHSTQLSGQTSVLNASTTPIKLSKSKHSQKSDDSFNEHSHSSSLVSPRHSKKKTKPPPIDLNVLSQQSNVPTLHSSSPKIMSPLERVRTSSGHRRVHSFDVSNTSSHTSLSMTSRSPIDQATQLKQILAQQRREEDHKFLLNCVLLMEPFFSDNIPVMPYVVYRTLKHWQVFVNDDDKLLTKILTTIENTTQTYRDSNSLLVYWLSASLTLYVFVRQDKDNPQSKTTSEEYENMTHFETALKNVIESIAELFFSNVQSSLDKLIQPLFLTPTQLTATIVTTEKTKLDEQMTQLTQVFDLILKQFTSNHIFDDIKIQLFEAIFKYLNAQLMSSMLIRSTCGQGVHLKLTLNALEEWILQAAGSTLHQSMKKCLKQTYQAANVTCLNQKETLLHGQVRAEVCPDLSLDQLQRLLLGYVQDEFDKTVLNKELFVQLNTPVVNNPTQLQPPPENRKADTHSSDTLSIKSTILNFDSLSKLQINYNLVSVTVPKFILERPSFLFLKSNRTSNNTNNINKNSS